MAPEASDWLQNFKNTNLIPKKPKVAPKAKVSLDTRIAQQCRDGSGLELREKENGNWLQEVQNDLKKLQLHSQRLNWLQKTQEGAKKHKLIKKDRIRSKRPKGGWVLKGLKFASASKKPNRAGCGFSSTENLFLGGPFPKSRAWMTFLCIWA